MIKIILNGCNGRMGKTISELAKGYNNLQIVAGIDKYIDGETKSFPVYTEISDFTGACDVVLDFSSPKSLPNLTKYCKERNIPLVLCTTGYNKEELKEIEALSKEIPVFHSGNMSLGINILSNVLKKISPILFKDYDIEIIEKHHNQKVDAPSGTALLLADSIKSSLKEEVNYVYGREGLKKRDKEEIGIHAIRGGSIVGEHEIIFAGKGETIELKHTALSRDVFASGALRACEFMAGKGPGLYDMDNVING
ncbi:MAG: 4-hydroxy-tetrahydrodipicolinate reductase [Clostridiales bacterium]|mgnify:CR=1 FL=1|uniref:4-hydroxy-tetrahydrodipicolinate reductase n=1 Tax=Clostridium sp. N3C TaxID=1776758 RepID=UPI00092E1687|nr:4-hydroxy-tetrahydrodipicolinate reductase [Clostridium sp. N3C]NLZ48953.1 4-hydroxy-tetrahydrodipicolinate reductase [Clostridiales bacterium]SCN21439.1 4-hydroxy-tetrahydrodipicolinate reductase [Clostridium sp. N3C]